MAHVRDHYYTSHPTLNPYSIVPKRAAPGTVEALDAPHNRAERADSNA